MRPRRSVAERVIRPDAAGLHRWQAEQEQEEEARGVAGGDQGAAESAERVVVLVRSRSSPAPLTSAGTAIGTSTACTDDADRRSEFGDDKVLLLHQKAKHFKCHACPRRLNTAGGLAVHLDQVHKLPAERITNAMPGRDTFDVEIYGMEGIPRDDLMDWKKRKAAELGEDSLEAAALKLNKRRVYLGPIAADELRRMLDTHRGLMSGAPSASAQAGSMAVQSGLPQIMAAPHLAALQAPPAGFALPPGFPMPPPGLALPPGCVSRTLIALIHAVCRRRQPASRSACYRQGTSR